MAITGTITIPEQNINYTDVTGLVIQKGGTVKVYTDKGVSFECTFSNLWANMSAAQKTGLTSLIDIIAAQSVDTVSTSGDF